LKILITAGAVTERIDAVRCITNSATGKLGALTAEAFFQQAEGKLEKIIYVCEKSAVVPDIPCLEIVHTQGTAELDATIQRILSVEKPDAVIHSMAVSDYMVESISIDDTGILRPVDTSTKLSSDIDHLVLHLRRTPKIIGHIRSLAPDAVLVGFKLLDGVALEDLLETSHKLLVRNRCDLVLANDARTINGNEHTGYLVFPDRSRIRIDGKAHIAEAIAHEVLNLLAQRNTVK